MGGSVSGSSWERVRRKDGGESNWKWKSEKKGKSRKKEWKVKWKSEKVGRGQREVRKEGKGRNEERNDEVVGKRKNGDPRKKEREDKRKEEKRRIEL